MWSGPAAHTSSTASHLVPAGAAHADRGLAHAACLCVTHAHDAGVHSARDAVVVLAVQLRGLIGCGRRRGRRVRGRLNPCGFCTRTVNGAGGLQVVHGARVHQVAHGEALDGLILQWSKNGRRDVQGMPRMVHTAGSRRAAGLHRHTPPQSSPPPPPGVEKANNTTLAWNARHCLPFQATSGGLAPPACSHLLHCTDANPRPAWRPFRTHLRGLASAVTAVDQGGLATALAGPAAVAVHEREEGQVSCCWCGLWTNTLSPADARSPHPRHIRPHVPALLRHVGRTEVG